jgi:hypothetical protein
LALKTGEVQVGVERVALREDFRIILENFSSTVLLSLLLLLLNRPCGLVVSVEDYKHRGPRFDSRALLRIFLREFGLERGPLSLVFG